MLLMQRDSIEVAGDKRRSVKDAELKIYNMVYKLFGSTVLFQFGIMKRVYILRLIFY